MLARRARIKALAAVPVRKKASQDSIDSNNVADKEQKKENESNINETEQKEVIKDVAKIEDIRTKVSERKEESSNSISEENVVKTEASEQKEDISSINILKPEKQESISSSSVSNREAVKDVAKIQNKTTNEERNTVSLEESVTNEKSDSQELSSPLKANSQGLCTQVKPNSQEFLCTGIMSDKISSQLVQKTIPPLDSTTTAIDIASPTKLIQSRSCFMRPIPRLDSSGRIRKNSIQGSGASASESEDEHSKRVASVVPSRVRNDSVCSVQSNKESTINDNQNNIPKSKTTQKKRMLISESARKLAEARREFLLKHENRTPDRSQLKMYDLIYYNPVTNPMKKLSVERKVQSITTPQPVEVPEEENEDDPSVIATPQVKVGPDGQLIVDEQSLVVEQTDVKGSDEMSEAIIEDDSHSGGFYKRHKRSKDWPKWETFKFYRVLNVVGTDFLLMKTLFPNRSRQEIKQKYKKEERINRHLVEKALKYHQEFNTDMLEEQLAILQKLENIPDNEKSKKAPEKNKNNQSLTRIERKRLVADSIGECEALSTHNQTEQQETEDTAVSTTNEEINIEMNGNTNDFQQQTRGKKSKARRSKKRVEDKPQEIVFDDHSSCTDADSDSSEEVYQLRPTRSGRLPKKIRKLQAPDPSTINSNDKNESVDDETAIPSHEPVEVTEYVNTPNTTNSGNTETSSDNIISMIPNINQMEPGALVIISKESAENPGNTILQVYMVASNMNSSTMVTPLPVVSAASENQSSEPLTTKSENGESINIVDDTEK
ncbi:transcription factor TFIIIB component B'' homolog isoform X2 [Monomorium pharaonis]|uniref:transcription factor TFIIIB component B'' homolog isoform X2 n=1 Tax=Monomorium pharaonis TaxID=307658 RepID=UPI00063F79D1|nr:transcription factor TFIIIB component B'' homolog isoform X2 [Monomorium pharaonis]